MTETLGKKDEEEKKGLQDSGENSKMESLICLKKKKIDIFEMIVAESTKCSNHNNNFSYLKLIID